MARNGAGVYTLPATSFSPAVTGTTIESSAANTVFNDLASAMTQSVSKDGQTPMTGNLPMGDNKLTGLADGAAATDSMSFGQGAKLAGGNIFTGDQTINGSVSLSGSLTVTGPVIFTSGTINVGTLTASTITLISSASGSAAGPIMALNRLAADPAAGGKLGQFLFNGRNGAAGLVEYAGINGLIQDATNGSEQGIIQFRTIIAGVPAVRMSLWGGIFATGLAEQGQGTSNVTGSYVNGVSIGTTLYRSTAIGITVGAADGGGTINFTAAGVTCALTSAATLGAGFRVTIINSAASGVVTIDPSGAETLDGLATRALSFGRSRVTIQSDGTNWWTVDGTYLFQVTGGTVTLGADYTVAHALGVKPDWLTIWLVCVTAQGNYSIGDEIVGWWLGQNTASQGINPRTDATNIVINQSSVITILDKTGHTFVNITAANWSWKIIAGAR